MRKILLCGALLGTALFASAVPTTYDEIGALRPADGSDAYWDPSAHEGVAIDVCDSTPVPVDARAAYAIRASAGVYDLRRLTFGFSSGIEFDTFPIGYLFFLR